MARVIAPFKIVGTIDDLNFYLDDQKINRVREKGKTGVSSKEFMKNPVFQKVKNHGREFGRCTAKAQNFRQIAVRFNNRAKDSSFPGRANKLMLDVLNEDFDNAHGERTVEKGMESADARSYYIGFEGNKLRPLKSVLKTDWTWDEVSSLFSINSFTPTEHIDWPEQAQQVHLAIARANWNYIDNKFTTEYSDEIIFEKNEIPSDISLRTATPEGNHLQLLFLFIGFSFKDRKKTKELKRSNNTVSIIWSR